MIYVILYSMIMPGTPTGQISSIFENAFTDKTRAMKAFEDLKLDERYFRKELWLIEPGGRRSMIGHEKFNPEEGLWKT